jgi:RimJ/RimL family protein N-acetyltransferase|tara:strand:+ start:5124 stop:5714 length:591 start_codon:yes stop_codon:yes gene_type:complete
MKEVFLKKVFQWNRRNRPEHSNQGNFIIEGTKVVLRQKRIEDAFHDYQWRIDPELSKLDATFPLRIRYKEFVRFSLDEIEYPGRRSKRLAIDTKDGVHIGNCMYYDLDERRGQTELGIMIGDRDYWNGGYGTDAVVTLAEHIFKTISSINKIYLHTLDWNDRARKSFAKAGFVEVREVKRDGQNFVLMEMERSGLH